MDLGLALPKAAVFMSGPEMRRAFRRVPPSLRTRPGLEIFNRPVREGGFAGRCKIEQNTSFVPFRGWREPQAGRLFLCAGIGGRRPSPPQRASTSCAPPPPEGEGDGRGKGRGLRAEAPGEEGPGSGQARRGTGQSPHAPEAGPPEHRPRGTAQGPPRGEWRAAPPRVGAGPTGGRQRLPQAPRSGPRAAPPGARAGDSGPPPTAGAAHAPHLVRPGADPRRGRARGKRGTERGPGRREPPQGGPAAAAPRRPAARSTIPKGRRPAQKESAQAVAWTLPGRKTLGRVNPLRVYRTTAAALLSSPRRGRPLT